MCNVNIVTGELFRYQVDVFLPGYIPVEIARTYQSGVSCSGIMGGAWMINLLMTLRQDRQNLTLVDEEGVTTRLLVADTGEYRWENADTGVSVVRQGEELVL